MKKLKQITDAVYLIVALLLVMAVMMTGLYFNRSMVITEITLQGNHMTDPDEILASSRLSEGMHGDSIVFLEVIERVEKMPWVASAHVNLSQSGKVRIRVEEEEPMALLIDQGRTALVTESGIQLPLVLGKSVDVPLVYGFKVTDNADTLQSASFQKVRSFLTRAKAYPGLYAMISEVMVTDTDGVVVLTNENAVRLTFGHENFDDRLHKWKAFQSQVIPEKGIRSMRSLDFRFRGQVVAQEQ